MENNLAQKQDWKERRVKRGEILDRKDQGNTQQREYAQRIRDQERKIEYSALMIGICLLMALLMMIYFAKPAHSQEIPSQQALVTAIWHAEGGNKTHWPYGIKHHYKHTTARQASINTIRHRLRSWNGQDDPIVWIGLTYSPPKINPNWVKLVKFYLHKEGY